MLPPVSPHWLTNSSRSLIYIAERQLNQGYYTFPTRYRLKPVQVGNLFSSIKLGWSYLVRTLFIIFFIKLFYFFLYFNLFKILQANVAEYTMHKRLLKNMKGNLQY